MRNKDYLKYAVMIMFVVIYGNSYTNASSNKWIIRIMSLLSIENPQFVLDSNEIEQLSNMIFNEMTRAVKVAKDDKNKHQSQDMENDQYDLMSTYRGFYIEIRNENNENIGSYQISGRFIRKSYDEENLSELFKMNSKDIEEYLIQLGIKKRAIDVNWEKLIKGDIKKMKE